MGLRKAQDPNIDPRAPWVNDDLQRQREGVLLMRLIQSLTGLCIAVKGSRGIGKSVFLRRLSATLENAGVPVIPIDAWRTDYFADPLIAFVAATEQRIADERTRAEARVETGKMIANELAKYAGKLSPALAGAVADTFLPGAGAVTTAVAESVERGGEALLKAIKDKKDAETRFREQLGEARDFLTNRPRTRPVKPIVVTIDELDRCRPTYAVKVLERIKHYFDVPGIVFVIATDGTNLPNAVGSVYGAKIDGELYLRKFFDYEFDLQDPDPRRFVRVLADQFDFNPIIESANVDRAALVQCIERPTDFGYESRVHARDRALDAAEIVEAFPYFAKNLGLSLRDQAQAFTLINAYFRTLPPRVVIYPPMLTFIYCLRFASPMLYHQIRADKIEWNELLIETRCRARRSWQAAIPGRSPARSAARWGSSPQRCTTRNQTTTRVTCAAARTKTRRRTTPSAQPRIDCPSECSRTTGTSEIPRPRVHARGCVFLSGLRAFRFLSPRTRRLRLVNRGTFGRPCQRAASSTRSTSSSAAQRYRLAHSFAALRRHQ